MLTALDEQHTLLIAESNFYDINRDIFWRFVFVAAGPFLFFLLMYLYYGRGKKEGNGAGS